MVVVEYNKVDYNSDSNKSNKNHLSKILIKFLAYLYYSF